MKVLVDLDNLSDEHLDLLIGNLFTRGVMENGGELEKLGLALSQEWRRRNPEELPPSILRTGRRLSRRTQATSGRRLVRQFIFI